MRFVAVHGGLHGAWCWDPARAEMEKLGHELVAVELPGHGARVEEPTSLEAYVKAVLEVLRPGDVLVGHSAGCGIAVLAADAAIDRVAHLCLVAGIVPVEGKPLPYETALPAIGGNADTEAGPGADADEAPTPSASSYMRLTDDGSAFYFERPGAEIAFYNDCSPEVVDWAYPQLVPEPLAPLRVPVSVPAFWQSDLSRSFIMGLRDATCTPPLARMRAKRLGVVPLEIDTGHSPFLSRPAEFARLLVHATGTSPVGPLIPTTLMDPPPDA
jgi:pimeloyl-ACP methyl ester carboxylesterase